MLAKYFFYVYIRDKKNSSGFYNMSYAFDEMILR